MPTERKLDEEPLCQYVYQTEAPLKGELLRCEAPLSEHGLGMLRKHGFVREAFTCHHTIDGKRCGIQQMHWIHDPQYGQTHMFTPKTSIPRNDSCVPISSERFPSPFSMKSLKAVCARSPFLPQP